MNIENPSIINDGFLEFDYTKFDVGCFKSLNSPLRSLKGCHEQISNQFDVFGCVSLTSLEYAPKKVGFMVDLRMTGITSIEGIGVDYFLEIDGVILLPKYIRKDFLQFFKIKKLKKVEITTEGNDILMWALSIVNKHLLGSRRVTKCREELIDAGLKEFC
jgi:hypothetical protein